MTKIFSRELVTVPAIMGLGVLSMSLLQPILPLYLTDIGVSPEIVGLMLSVAMVGMVIGESFWGWVADKVGLKLPLGAGAFVSTLVIIFFTFTRSVPAIFTIFFFWGLFRSALFGPGRGYIGAKAPLLRKATYLAFITVLVSASRSIGALPSGFIVDNWGYHWSFFAASGIAFLGGMVVVTGLKKIKPVKPEPAAVSLSPADELPNKAGTLNYRPFTFQCLVTFFQFWGFGILMTFLPLLATQVAGISATEVGILFTIRGITSMALAIPMGMLADRVGKKVFMVLGLIVSAAAMAGLASAESFSWLIVFVTGTSLGLAMFSPAALGMISVSVPLHRQGTAMGVYGGICENIGIIAGSSLGGFVWITWGPQPTFLMGTVTASLGALICLFLVKEKASEAA